MNDELFSVPVQLSPKLAWIQAHNISIEHHKHLCPGDEPWSAWIGMLSDAIENDKVGTGETEYEALVSLALAAGIKLWSEQ